MNSLVFYKDTIINQEIAFVFDFSYTYINSFDELTTDKFCFACKKPKCR